MKTWRHGIAGTITRRAWIGLSVLVACSNAAPGRSGDSPNKSNTASFKPSCWPWTAPSLSAPGAFDLALISDGALLVWSPRQGGLRVQVLDRSGAPRGAPRDVIVSNVPAHGDRVIEVAATAAAGDVGFAWVTAQADGHMALAGRTSERAPQALSAESLGAVEVASGTRGRVLIASSEDGEISATWRNERAACQAQTGVCSHYARRAIHLGDHAARPVIAREMVAPCESMLVGSLWADGSWYEAVCHHDPEPVAYLFSFRPEISYAEATELMAGCSAFALSRAQIGAALWATCPEGLTVAARSHLSTTSPVLRGVTEAVRCEASRPVLAASTVDGVFELPLAAAVDGIGAALPGVPFDTRAVWTGSHVIAAFEAQGALRLVTGACGPDGFNWCGLSPRP